MCPEFFTCFFSQAAIFILHTHMKNPEWKPTSISCKEVYQLLRSSTDLSLMAKGGRDFGRWVSGINIRTENPVCPKTVRDDRKGSWNYERDKIWRQDIKTRRKIKILLTIWFFIHSHMIGTEKPARWLTEVFTCHQAFGVP